MVKYRRGGVSRVTGGCRTTPAQDLVPGHAPLRLPATGERLLPLQDSPNWPGHSFPRHPLHLPSSGHTGPSAPTPQAFSGGGPSAHSLPASSSRGGPFSAVQSGLKCHPCRCLPSILSTGHLPALSISTFHFTSHLAPHLVPRSLAERTLKATVGG